MIAIVVGLGAFLFAFAAGMSSVALPTLALELGVSPSTAGWVPGGYLATVTALLFVSGRIADRIGRKQVYLAGAALFGLGALGAAVAPTFAQLIAARVLQGVGAAGAMATGPAILVDAVPLERRGRALGTSATLTYLGLAAGPSAGGVVTASLGFRAVFWVALAAAALLVALASATLPRGRRGAPSPLLPALLGGVASAAALACVQRVAVRHAIDVVVVVAAMIAIGSAAFLGSPSRVVPKTLLGERAFRSGIVAASAHYGATFAIGFATPFLLERALGATPTEAGLFMTVQPIAMMLASPLAGVLADRVTPLRVARGGLGLLAAGALALALFGASRAGFVASAALFGAGAGFFTTPNNAIVLGAAGPETRASASAAMAWARTFGMTAGVASAAIVFATGSDATQAFRASALVALAFAAVGLLASRGAGEPLRAAR